MAGGDMNWLDLFHELARRWRRRQRWIAGLRAVAVLVPTAAVATTLAGGGAPPAWALGVAVAGVALAVTAVRGFRRPVDLSTIARHLDAETVELEQSAELLLAEPDALPLVARLQRARLLARLDAGGVAVELPTAAVRSAGWWAAGAMAVAALIPLVGDVTGAQSIGATAAISAPPAELAGEPLAIHRVGARIEPPAYTGRPAREVEGLDLVVEQDAMVTWRVASRGGAVGATLVFDETEPFALEPAPAKRPGAPAGVSGREFVGSRRAEESHLYRLELAADGTRLESDFARLVVQPDRAPEIRVVAPPPFLELSPEEVGGLEIVAEVRDDHGVAGVVIVATVASGFGELVEFRERRLEFDDRSALSDGPPGLRLRRRLDLEALGVRSGVELFFHVEATDRRPPESNRSRSSTHIVRVPGGGPRSVGLSARLPILRVPEFFRSQRQIILDTEKLVAEGPTLTEAEFRRRSEGLGFDQRALRLRYGGLLGEEFSSGRPAGVDSEEGVHEGEELRLEEMESGREDAATEVLEGLGEGMVHEHDSAEIATFFDSEIRAQLKAALAEMWDAEGRLRGIEPRKALPYEFRALRLLKDVQQRSRLYVQKVGFEAPELFPAEKRLSGELGGIRTVRRRRNATTTAGDREAETIAATLAGLRSWRLDGVPPEGLLALAEQAARLLAVRARDDAKVDLGGLGSVRAALAALEGEASVPPETFAAAEAALWNLLPEPEVAPELGAQPSTRLGEAYRRRVAEGTSR